MARTVAHVEIRRSGYPTGDNRGFESYGYTTVDQATDHADRARKLVGVTHDEWVGTIAHPITSVALTTVPAVRTEGTRTTWRRLDGELPRVNGRTGQVRLGR